MSDHGTCYNVTQWFALYHGLSCQTMELVIMLLNDLSYIMAFMSDHGTCYNVTQWFALYHGLSCQTMELVIM